MAARIFISILFSFAFYLAGAQQLGLRSPAVNWMQINTDEAKVIFPEGREENAREVAAFIADMAVKYPSADPDARKWKIDILLQDATDITNGYVGYAPFRSEFYLAPGRDPFTLGTIPWHKLLALHEYRHVQQGYAGRRGWSKVVHILFGQEAYNGARHLSVPDWFFEGDAVVAETDLSIQGRGRLSSFLDGFREKAATGEMWQYDKLRNGSFREWLPSHYPLGYLMIGYGRYAYGDDTWDNTFKSAMAYRPLLYPFSSALKRETGLSTSALYTETMTHYADVWNENKDTSMASIIDVGYEDRYLDLHTPAITESGQLLVLGRRFDANAAIYTLAQGQLKRITTVGLQHTPAFSYGGGKLCWTEIRQDPRWTRKDYSVLVVFDLASGKKRQITTRTHMYTPGMSPDGNRIAAVCRKPDLSETLCIVDPETGNTLEEIPNPAEWVFSFPTWSGDMSELIVLSRTKRGHSQLVKITIKDGESTLLADFAYSPVGRPMVNGDWILMSSNAPTKNVVLGYNLRTGRIHQFGNGGYAAYDPVADMEAREIVFCGFTLQGRRLFTFPFTQGDGTTAPLPKRERIPGVVVPYYSVSKYPALSRPINFHSWSVDFEDPLASITLSSTNILHTVELDAGFRYNFNDESYGPFAQLRFGYLYPEILLGYNGTQRKDIYQGERYQWFQHNLFAGVSVPLRFVQSQSFIDIIPSAFVQHLETSGDIEVGFNNLQGGLRLAHRKARAFQHPISRFGQWINLRYLRDIDTLRAEQFAVETDFTFPSPIRNHVIWLQFDYQRELESNDFFFSDLFDYARGYPAVGGDDVWRLGINYHAPILYPDFGLFGIAYWKRFGITAFYDYNRAVSSESSTDFSSLGLEAVFDLKIFNVEDVTIGFRWAYAVDASTFPGLKDHHFAFFIPFDRF